VLLVEQLSTPADFPKHGGALPVSLDLSVVPGTDDKMIVEATATTPTELLTPMSTAHGLAADIDLFVAVHDDTGQLLAMRQTREHVALAGKDGSTEPAVLPRRLRLAAGLHTVTFAVHDPISGLTGMASAVAGGL